MVSWRAAIVITVAGCSTILGINDVKRRDAGTGNDALADGPADAAPDSPADALTADRIVFTTSRKYSANLNGLLGADLLCTTLAGSAQLPGTYKAWLSDNTTGPASPGRMTHSTGHYVLVNGTQVASGWDGLTSGTLLHAIDLSELGSTPPTSTAGSNGGCDASTDTHFVYTNTYGSGTPKYMVGSDNCSDWTVVNMLSAGMTGHWNSAGSDWTAACYGGLTCKGSAAIYCVQQ